MASSCSYPVVCIFLFAVWGIYSCCSFVAASKQRTKFSPHRLEVEFTRLENFGGIKYTGWKCDTFFGSKCDPLIYAAIQGDNINPLSFPPERTESFQLLFYTHNEDTFNINRIIQKDICSLNGSQTSAAVFARVIDYDLLKTDLMEDFTCDVAPRDVGRGTIDLGKTAEGDWSDVSQCLPMHHQGNKIRLFYRWRRTPLNDAECKNATLPMDFYLPHRSQYILRGITAAPVL